MKHVLMHLANKIFRKVRKVVWFRNIVVREQVLIPLFWFIAISQEELEEMKETQKFKSSNGTLTMMSSMI